MRLIFLNKMNRYIEESCLFSNDLEQKLEIDKIMELKIKSLSIQIIPLYTQKFIKILRKYLGTFLQSLIHPALLSPTFSHIAIQLNMENDDIIILEYGPYIENSNQNKSKIKINNVYSFINKVGIRITKIDKKKFPKSYPYIEIKKYLSNKIATIIASQLYNLTLDEFFKMDSNSNISESFKNIECDVENKITLQELSEHFKEKIGYLYKYNKHNFINKNNHTFISEIIKLVKAKRKYEKDKIRLYEKTILPNCIISNLWDNEELSVKNTIGRIPILGIFFDLKLMIFN